MSRRPRRNHTTAATTPEILRTIGDAQPEVVIAGRHEFPPSRQTLIGSWRVQRIETYRCWLPAGRTSSGKYALE
jgi:hypothetical protein